MTKLVRRTMLVGLGAALFLAGSAHAQQGMDPSFFLDTDPVAAGVEQDIESSAEPGVVEPGIDPVDGLRIAQDTSATMWLGIESKMATALLSLGRITPGQEAELKELKIVDSLLVMILLGGTGLIVWYATAITRRARHLEFILKGNPLGTAQGPASGATTH